ncbi:acetamidase/formamidase family protein [Clostridium lundense]|uniref:acetamidase/formamidase family protein n=1 Tax=Clostridium lundense TaxID=319475 RepID=UPI0031015DB4
MDGSKINGAVGPIWVKGACEGDILCVEINDIILNNKGVMTTNIGLGVLGDKIKEPNSKIIPVKDGFAYFNEDIKISVNPMIGVIGVAPKEDSIRCVTPGDHGSNMDTKEITIGSKVYLPVFVEGAKLALGDLHASMGDGELSGTGIEIGGKVRIKVSIIKGKTIKRPRIDSKDYLIIVSSGKDYKEAIKIAAEDMVDFLSNELNLKFEDAYRLVSATCDIRISQVVNPLLTVKICLPKKKLNIYEFKI